MSAASSTSDTCTTRSRSKLRASAAASWCLHATWSPLATTLCCAVYQSEGKQPCLFFSSIALFPAPHS